MKFCSRCGAQQDDNAMFCDKCGAQIPNIQSAPQQPYYQQPYQQPYKQPFQQPYHQYPVNQPLGNTLKKKSFKPSFDIIIIMILCAEIRAFLLVDGFVNSSCLIRYGYGEDILNYQFNFFDLWELVMRDAVGTLVAIAGIIVPLVCVIVFGWIGFVTQRTFAVPKLIFTGISAIAFVAFSIMAYSEYFDNCRRMFSGFDYAKYEINFGFAFYTIVGLFVALITLLILDACGVHLIKRKKGTA